MNDWIMPGMILAVLWAGAWKHLPMYDLFARGGAEGMRTAVRVLPNLAAMLCAISVMRTSGLMDALCALCSPLLTLLGLPAQTAPLILLRPLSGSGALAVVQQLMEQHGADSRIGLIACTVMGSSETIFYTVCVYMSAAENRNTGYAIPCALAGAFAGTLAAGMLF